MSNEALLYAIRIVGSGKKLAAKLKISPQRLNAWLNNEVEIPLEYGRLLELITDGRVTCEQITPRHMARIPKEWKNRFFNHLSAPPHNSPLSAEDLLNPNFVGEDRISKLSIVEKIKLGLVLEEKLKHQGQRNDLKQQLRPNLDEVKDQNDLSLCKNFYEVSGRSDDFIAKKLGLRSKMNYHHAKAVVQKGCMELIQAVDKKTVAI